MFVAHEDNQAERAAVVPRQTRVAVGCGRIRRDEEVVVGSRRSRREDADYQQVHPQ